MAPSGQTLPHRLDPPLPLAHIGIGCTAMLGVEQATARLQDATQFGQGARLAFDRAQGEGTDYCIEALIRERNALAKSLANVG